ncbi:hypothetical protein Q75_02920 [Bacillus coahuilensis p1.1.43]|uniref:Uncharacterized protein n=1 Tax=Bacillus coahuilensis p1.1.43 TaxID=1150625 RepID=A0A147KBB8_9BACI|nr:hypothetical protein [Bacillus coahuilensis]KUP08432.1 hypothetical protein Q75_02920 [Bacillus coahuilensis p1.1.43]
MQQVIEKLQENLPAPGHILSNKGGVAMQNEVQLQQEEIKTEEQPEELKHIEGKCGTITILKPSREVAATDEDIHSLLARILLKKQKRLAEATGE